MNDNLFQYGNYQLQLGEIIVKEKSDERRFIKIYFGTLNNTKCQTFYKSSGINSGAKGTWYPTDSMSMDTKFVRSRRENFWLITKKPWVVQDAEDENPMMLGAVNDRFDGNPEVKFVSQLLTNDPSYAYTGNNEEWKNFYELYSNDISSTINSVLPEVEMNNYEINQWIDVNGCFSYTWHKSYYKKFPDFVPDLNPTTSHLYMENNDGKMVLPKSIFTNRKLGHELNSLKVLEKRGAFEKNTVVMNDELDWLAAHDGKFDSKKVTLVDKYKKKARLQQIRNLLINKGAYPDISLMSLESIRERERKRERETPLWEGGREYGRERERERERINYFLTRVREEEAAAAEEEAAAAPREQASVKQRRRSDRQKKITRSRSPQKKTQRRSTRQKKITRSRSPQKTRRRSTRQKKITRSRSPSTTPQRPRRKSTRQKKITRSRSPSTQKPRRSNRIRRK
jgi:hypothetical protein